MAITTAPASGRFGRITLGSTTICGHRWDASISTEALPSGNFCSDGYAEWNDGTSVFFFVLYSDWNEAQSPFVSPLNLDTGVISGANLRLYVDADAQASQYFGVPNVFIDNIQVITDYRSPDNVQLVISGRSDGAFNYDGTPL